MNTKHIKTIYTITKIIRGICVGFTIASVILLIIALILPDHYYHYLVNFSGIKVNAGTISLILTHELVPEETIKLPISILLLSSSIVFALTGYALTILKRIIDSFMKKEPFREQVSKNLKKLALISLIIILILPAFNALEAYMTLKLYPLSMIFNEDNIAQYQINYSLNLVLLVIPAFLYVLSNVFEYGTELQMLSDETV